MCIYIYIYLYVCEYIYIYTYIHTHRVESNKVYKYTGRNTDKHIHRKRERQIYSLKIDGEADK
jgi:hypothetical protein